MPIRARKKVRLGPRFAHVAWNFTQDGYASRSYKVGPWSWNTRTRRQRIDLPGPLHWIGQRKPPRNAKSAKADTERKPPRDLMPAANSCTVLASVCAVASLVFAAPMWVAALAVGFGGGAVTLAAKHVRNERAQGRRGLPFLPEPGSQWGTYRSHYSIPQPAPAAGVPCGCRSGSRCPGVGKCRCAKCRAKKTANAGAP